MDAATLFGAEIYRLRVELGWPQVRLAGKARLSKAYISAIENGRVPPPPERTTHRIASALALTACKRGELISLARVARCSWTCNAALPAHLGEVTSTLLRNARKLSPQQAAEIRILIEELAM
jgi:transcriptional regulator with XRE-family HTH domain